MLLATLLATLLLPLLSCSQAPDPNTLVMTSRTAPMEINGQSERIDELLFDARC